MINNYSNCRDFAITLGQFLAVVPLIIGGLYICSITYGTHRSQPLYPKDAAGGVALTGA